MLGRNTIRYILALLAVSVAASTSCQFSPPVISEPYNGVIYYYAGTGIWSTRLSDGQTLLLVDGVALETRHYLSPDQEWLSYTVSALEGGEVMSLWVVGTRGDAPVQVSREVRMLESNWLQNGLLLYTEYPEFHIGSGTGRVEWGAGTTYSFDPETGTRLLAPHLQPWLTDHSQCTAFLTPAGHGDMVEACTQPGNGFLRVVGIDGSHPITIATSYRGEVEWSSDGEELAFTGYGVDGRWRLAIWNRRDENVREVVGTDSQGEYNFTDLSWSPNGEWIAFQGRGNDLCVVRVEDGEVRCFPGYVSALGIKPAWSPDSQAVILSTNRIGELLMGDSSPVWDLFIVSIPDGHITRVTTTPEMEYWPVWAR